MAKKKKRKLKKLNHSQMKTNAFGRKKKTQKIMVKKTRNYKNLIWQVISYGPT